jgi:hypothetical protein
MGLSYNNVRNMGLGMIILIVIAISFFSILRERYPCLKNTRAYK